MMLRFLAIAFVPIILVATPAAAVTSEEKMETCKIGADSQQLDSAKRTAFMKKCMAKGNYEPPARKSAKKTAKQPKPQ
jgi:hypothetical protein